MGRAGWGEREKEAERGRERNIDVRNIDWLPPTRAPTRDITHNLGMRPDQGQNPKTFGVWDDTLTNRATWPGQNSTALKWFNHQLGYSWGTYGKQPIDVSHIDVSLSHLSLSLSLSQINENMSLSEDFF